MRLLVILVGVLSALLALAGHARGAPPSGQGRPPSGGGATNADTLCGERDDALSPALARQRCEPDPDDRDIADIDARDIDDLDHRDMDNVDDIDDIDGVDDIDDAIGLGDAGGLDDAIGLDDIDDIDDIDGVDEPARSTFDAGAPLVDDSQAAASGLIDAASLHDLEARQHAPSRWGRFDLAVAWRRIERWGDPAEPSGRHEVLLVATWRN